MSPASTDLARALLAIREHYNRMEEVSRKHHKALCDIYSDENTNAAEYLTECGIVDDQLYESVQDLITLGEE